MTLIAFLPVLVRLSEDVTELPLVGAHPLCAGGRGDALVGVRHGRSWRSSASSCPGCEFRNQRVEAAYRKELVYGEDDAEPRRAADRRASCSPTCGANYFRLYFHYMYFNVARISYLQADNIFRYIVLAPTIVAGAITLGAHAADPQRLRAGARPRSSIWSIRGRRSSSCCRSTSACAPSRR